MTYPPKACAWCNHQFVPKRFDQSYCKTVCNDAAMKLELARGRIIYRAAYWLVKEMNNRKAWKLGHWAANLRFIKAEVRAWIEADERSQRKPPPRHDHQRDLGHQRRPADWRETAMQKGAMPVAKDRRAA